MERKMDELVKKPIFWAVVVMGCLVMGMFFVKILEQKVTNRVLNNISQPYNPSPFGPGIDMDKIEGKRAIFIEPQVETQMETQIPYTDWEKEWEMKRTNLSQ